MSHRDPRQPTFMIIGPPKSGTTSIFSSLCSHPEIYSSSYKETLFFLNDQEYSNGLKYYLDTYFRGAEKYKCRGEATPSYLLGGDKVISRIKNHFDYSRMKFIVILRDPVERCWSHYLHRKRSLHEILSFEDALAAETKRLANGELFAGYYEYGRYGHQLSQWMTAGSRDQFLLLRYEDVCNSYGKALAEVFRFLGVDENHEISESKRKNQAGDPRFLTLMKFLRSEHSITKLLAKQIIPSAIRRKLKVRLKQINVKPFTAENKPVMPSSVGDVLRQKYRSDIELLESLSGMDFSQWKSS